MFIFIMIDFEKNDVQERLSRRWFDMMNEYPEWGMTAIDTALYFYIIYCFLCVNDGEDSEFDLHSYLVMEYTGIRSKKQYKNSLGKLMKHGFLNILQKNTGGYTPDQINLSL